MENKSLWVEITGLDGTGKTTLKENLEKYIKGLGHSAHSFKFPYDKHLLGLLDVSGNGQPLQDNYTDTLIFALDNRILDYYIRDWKKQYKYLISQRGFIDSFVHGEVRGYSYEETDTILRTHELTKCDVMIHLNADPEIAFKRIQDDPDADKFETIDYIIEQAEATEKAYKELVKGDNENLKAFKGIPNIYINTSYLTCEETFQKAVEELEKLEIL